MICLSHKKRPVFLSGLMLAALLLSACSGGGKKEVTIDPASLAAQLSEKTVTSDTLTETSSSMIAGIYFIPEDSFQSGAAYMSSGATACEAAVIECKNADQAKAVAELFKQRVASQSELYANYNAGEVEKLDKAVIKSAGKYAVLCVCDDPAKAESILKEAGF